MQNPRTSASKYSEIDGAGPFPTSEPSATRTDQRLPTDPVTQVPGRDSHAAGSPRGSAEADDAYLLRLCLDLKLDALMLALGAAASDPTCGPSSGPAGGNLHTAIFAPDRHVAATVDRLIDLTADPPSQRYTFRTAPVCTCDSPADVLGPHSDTTTAVTDTITDHITGGLAEAALAPVVGTEPVIRTEPVVGPIPVPPWQRWLREDVDMVRALTRELLAWGGGLPSSLGQAETPKATITVLNRLEAFHSEIRTLLGEVEAAADAAEATDPATGRIRAAIRHCRRRLTEVDQLRLQTAELQDARTTVLPPVPSGLPGEFLG